MRETIAFFVYYFKMMLHSKVTLVWSIVFPICFALISYFVQIESYNSVEEKENLFIYYWAFIVITTFINGVSIQISIIRDQGLLKTFYSLVGSKFPFLNGILLTQNTLIIISLTLFTLILGSVIGILSLDLLKNMIIFFIVIAPLSLTFLIIPFIPTKSEDISSIANILNLLLFLIAANSSNNLFGFEWLNPYYYLNQLCALIIGNAHHLLPVIIVYMIYITIGLFAIIKINLISKYKRT